MSETIKYVIDTVSSIYLSSTNEKVYNKFKSQINENHIPSLNNQLRIYEKLAMDTIEQEIYEELMKEVDWNKYQESITDHFRDGRFNIYKYENLDIPKFKFSIPQFEFKIDDGFDKKELSRYCKKIVRDTNIFENNVVRYKKEVKDYLLSRMNYLSDSFEFLTRNEKNHFRLSRESKLIEVPKSFRDFVKLCLESILGIC